MKKHVLYVVLFFALAFVSKSASAQAPSPMQSSGDFLGRQIMYDSTVMNSMMTDTRSAVKNGGGLRAKSGSASANANPRSPSGSANKKAARASITFTSTGSFIALGKLAKKMSNSPEDERKTEAGFINAVTFFNKVMKEKGYPTNDLAHATTALFVNCVGVYSGKDATQRQRDGIYNAFKEYYETSEYFQSLTNKQKQENYELTALMWATVYVNDSIAVEKGDKASRKRAKDTAETMMDEFIGAKINKVRLTDDGFEIVQ